MRTHKLCAHAEAKRLRGQGDMRSTFLHGRGATFAKRRAADHLASARVVRTWSRECCPSDRRADNFVLRRNTRKVVVRFAYCAVLFFVRRRVYPVFAATILG